LFQGVNAAKDASGETHLQWFLRACFEVDDELDAAYARPSEGEWRVPVPRRRLRAPVGEPLVSYQLPLERTWVALLEHWADELKAPSMSELVTTIVRLRLAQLGKTQQGEPQAAG
jgi:hypothetical protein